MLSLGSQCLGQCWHGNECAKWQGNFEQRAPTLILLKKVEILTNSWHRGKEVILCVLGLLFVGHILSANTGPTTPCEERTPPFSPHIYRVSQEECARLREAVPYVKVYRCNPKHPCPKLNGYGDNGQGSLKLWQLLHTY